MFAGSFEKLRRKMKDSRFRYAAVIVTLALVVLIGVVQASGPMKPHYPPQDDMAMGTGGRCCMGGKWGGMWGWLPMQPVPTITILEVIEDEGVAFSTSNLPDDEDFQVLMGPIHSRGVDGTLVDSFNSSDGVEERIYRIPTELQGDFRIAIRITTDHDRPYYSYNWFYNNDTNTAVSDPVSGSDASVADAPPSMEIAAVGEFDQTLVVEANEETFEPFAFEICAVERNETVTIYTDNFPLNENFVVQMGVMPEYPEAEPYYDGKMKKPMGPGQSNMGNSQPMGPDQLGMGNSQPMGPGQLGMGMEQGQKGYDKPGYQMPAIPPSKQMPKKPPMHWIPYYEAGSFVLEEGDDYLSFDIPSALGGAYRLSILVRTEHAYPYYAYNWFYNNDAGICGP